MYILAKLLKALHSDAGPWPLAWGIVLGMMMGLMPFYRVYTLLLLFVVLFFRVNLCTFLLSWALFSALALALDPLLHQVGQSLLMQPGLQSMWEALYSTGFGRLSQFFHTITLGAMVLGWLLLPILLPVSRILVIKYREHFLQWVEKLWIVQLVKGSRAYQLYQAMGN